MDLLYMDDSGETSGQTRGAALLAALRPALPAVIGAAALTFLFAAVMPMAWVAGISWNLYLDRLSDFFVPPVGNAARLSLALGMSAVAALLAGFVALVVATPEASGLAAVRRRVRRSAAETDEALPRRRADLHPDDLPRAPIRAGRDLPAGGLGPIASADDERAIAVPEAADWPVDGELILADLAPVEVDVEGEEPWLQPVESTGPAMPDPTDNSIGAMVARFEAGLASRRQAQAATAAIPVPAVPITESAGEEEIDFALEAALGTLQRMNRQAIG